MIFSSSQFLTHSLREIEGGTKVANVLSASINAVDPAAAVHSKARVEAGKLIIGSQAYNLTQYKNIYIVGAGKAGFPMASAISEILGDHLSGGIVIVKDKYPITDRDPHLNKISFIEAGHPLPDERGLAGTNRIIKLLQSTEEDDLVICLISGGGSALLTSPSRDIRLEDLQEMMRDLLRSGATIHEINALRKHLENLKGGKLVSLAFPARVISLILSDVVGDSLDAIASGPTAPDPSTFQEASLILERYQLIDRVPARILKHIQKGLAGELDETPKLNDPIFEKTQNLIIGNNKSAAQAGIHQAITEGFNTLLLTTYLQGEARSVGEFLASIVKQLKSDHPPVKLPACIICGGETTVVVKGDGKGGRNTELALGAVEPLSGLPDILLVSFATDGNDGPTDAAGAVVTGDTFQRAIAMNIKPHEYLMNNDSYHFFSKLDDLLKPGPTNTNVNDLALIFSF